MAASAPAYATSQPVPVSGLDLAIQRVTPPGDVAQVELRLTVTNYGPSDASLLQLSVSFGSNATFVSINGALWYPLNVPPVGSSLPLSLGSDELLAGDSSTVTLIVGRTPSNGFSSLSAKVEGDGATGDYVLFTIHI